MNGSMNKHYKTLGAIYIYKTGVRESRSIYIYKNSYTENKEVQTTIIISNNRERRRARGAPPTEL
jgi:hypothetical protein